ncbi:MAG: cell division protein SepF [Candidatus Marsarchaeota archaeon]|nr:cell division protein SepF [Candidatus Marsarchaeota archaeon]MCL5106428.1 cell division protein SepF [Candidatus Marsarchaeota archaeon]
MGVFDKLGKALGANKELDVEEYMQSAEMSNVDVMNEPADFYIKPVALSQESDVALIESELNKKNIILLNIQELSKRPNTLKGIIQTLKEYVAKIDGDIARIDEEKLLITPKKVKIIKSKKPAQR